MRQNRAAGVDSKYKTLSRQSLLLPMPLLLLLVSIAAGLGLVRAAGVSPIVSCTRRSVWRARPIPDSLRTTVGLHLNVQDRTIDSSRRHRAHQMPQRRLLVLSPLFLVCGTSVDDKQQGRAYFCLPASETGHAKQQPHLGSSL